MPAQIRPARSSQVELRWTKDDQGIAGGVAWLCNVSAEGLACRADMRISEVVDIPNWVVSCYFPRVVFD